LGSRFTGPWAGLPESTGEQCLAPELKLNGIAFRRQHPQPVEYRRFVLSPFVLFVSFVVRTTPHAGGRSPHALLLPGDGGETGDRFHHEEHEGTRRMDFGGLSNQVIGCAIEVHRALGRLARIHR
jgi:hypothetical protein